MKKMFIMIVFIFWVIPNLCYASEISSQDILQSQQDELNISSFIKEAQKYTNESFEEIDLSSMLGQAIQGKIDNNKLYKIIIKL